MNWSVTFRSGVAALVCVGWLGTGCKVAQQTAQLPVQWVSDVVSGGKPEPGDPAALQAAIQRFADDFVGRTTSAITEYEQRLGTPEARSEALHWRASMGSSIVGIASGPNPAANLVDLVALTTLMRSVLEELAPTAPRDALVPWWEASLVLETNAWDLASGVLTPSQQEELRTSLALWTAERSTARALFFARPQESAAFFRRTEERQRPSGSVFRLVGLDPTSGLDPAVREVTRTRLLAERALYTAQRMPFLVRWQLDLLADELLRHAPVAEALTAVDRLSRAAETTSRTAAQLPEHLRTERQAILAALETQEGRLRELSLEIGRTLAAGERMSTSLNTTLHTFDLLMKRFGVGEPAPTPPDTNAAPFNVLEYAWTADQVAAMAQQLQTLLQEARGTLDSPTLDRRLADVTALSAQARREAQAVLNHAFLVGAGLIALAVAGAAIHRHLGRRAALSGPP